jgi:hypothetical protein
MTSTAIRALEAERSPGEPVAWISSDAPALARWVTQRATWEEVGAEVAGDQQRLAVARKLKVF